MSDYQPKKSPSQWISIQEASHHAPYSQEYLSLLARRGKIFAKKIGRNWYTTHEALASYVSEQALLSPLSKQISASVDLASAPSNLVDEFKRLNPQAFPNENSSKPVMPVPVKEPVVEPAPQTPIISVPVQPVSKDNSVLEKLDKLSDSLETFASRVTDAIPKIANNQVSQTIVRENPEVEQFMHEVKQSSSYKIRQFNALSKSMVRSPVRLTTIMVSAVVVLFVLIGGFSFGQVDMVAQKIKKSFTDATTLQGHFAGTHANEVLVLDKAGNVSIYGHIETQGQLRSHAPDGVEPIVIDSMTKVENLNSDYFDNLDSKDFTLAFVTKNGNLTYEDVNLEGSVEVGKTLTVKGATKLSDSLQVYGSLGVMSDAVFGKNVTLNSGDLVIAKGTIKISNMSLVKNLNAEYLDGLKKGGITLDFVTSNGASTANTISIGGLNASGTGFFNGGVWGSTGSFGTVGTSDLAVSKIAILGDKTNPTAGTFQVYSSQFTVDANGNTKIAGSATMGSLIVNGLVGSSLVPSSSSYNLGSSNNRWGNIYAVDGNFTGNVTISNLSLPGVTSASFVINSDNATADTEDSYLRFSRGSVTPSAILAWDATNKQFNFNQPVNVASSSFSVSGQSSFSSASASLGFESNYIKTDSISNSTGTLTINAFTLGGLVTGNNQSITGLNQLISTIASVSSNFEVGGYASIGGNITTKGILVGSGTGSNSFAGSLDIASGLRAAQITGTGLMINGNGVITGTFNAASTSLSSLTVSGQSNFGNASSSGTFEAANNLIANNVLQVGGTSAVGYSRFGTGVTTHGLSTSSDLVVTGGLEVQGATYLSTIDLGVASVSGNFEIGGVLKASDGSAVAPSYTFTNDRNTGLYRVGSDTLGFATGGIQSLSISSTGASLSVPFEVNGYASISGNVIVGGTFAGSSAGSNSFAGSLDIVKGLRAAQITGTGLMINGNGVITGSLDAGATNVSSLTVSGQSSFSSASASLGFESNYIKTDSISNSTGTLTINAFTLGGLVTGNNQSITGLNQLISTIASVSSNFEVGGYASIGGNITTKGILVGSGTGSNSFAGSLDIVKGLRAANFTQVGSSVNYFNGNLGIGTSSPLTKLEIQGTASASNLLTVGSLQVANGGATVSYSRFGNNATTHSLSGANGLLISGNLEVDGITYFDNGLIITGGTSVSSDFEVGGAIKASDGTAISPSYSFKNDIDTGLFRIGTNNIGFATGGVLRLNVQDSGASASVVFEGGVIKGTIFTGDGAVVLQSGGSNTLTLDTGGSAAINIGTTNASSIAISRSGVVTVLGDDLRVSGNDIRSSDDVSRITLGTTTSVNATLLDLSGNLKITGGNIQDSSTANRLSFTTTGATGLLSITGYASVSQDFEAVGKIIGGGVLQVAGSNTTSYSRIGTATTTHGLSASNDLLVSGNLEVDGVAYFDSSSLIAGAASISSNFEVGGYASIGGNITTKGILVGSGTGSNSFAGSLNIAKSLIVTNGITGGTFNTIGQFFSSGTGSNSFAGSLDLTKGLNVNNGALRVTSGGNIGINTTSPAARLDVIGQIRSTNLVSSGVGQFGGTSTVSYSRFGTGVTSHSNYISANDDLLVSGDLEVNASAAFDGNVVIGDATDGSDLLKINSRINSDLIPSDANKNIGGASNRWNTAYFSTIDVLTLSVASVSISGTSNAAFTINSDNATADTENSQLVFSRGTSTPNAQIGWDTASKRFEFNFPIFVQTTDTLEPANNFTRLTLKAAADQGAKNYFEIQNNSGSNLFVVGAGGVISASGSFQAGGGSVATASYSRFGTSTTTHGLSAMNDLLISGKLEVVSPAFFNSTASIATNFEVGGYASIGGNGTIRGTLDVAGNTTLTGTLIGNSAGSNSFLGSLDITKGLRAAQITGSGLVINGNGSFTGTLSAGATTLSSLSTTGRADFGANASVSQTLEATTLKATIFTGDGAVSLLSGGSQTLRIDAGGAAALNIGDANASSLTLSRNGIITVINDDLRVIGNDIQDSASTARLTFATGYSKFNDDIQIEGGDIRDSSTANRLSFTTTGATGLLSITGYASVSQDFEAVGKIIGGGVLQVAGSNTTSYSRIGTATTTHGLSASNDLLVSGNLEVDGVAYFDSGTLIAQNASVSGNFEVGLDKLFVNGTSGNVGIGTNLPFTKFEVQGTASASNLLTVGSLQVANGGATVSYSRFGTSTTTHGLSASNDLLVSGNFETDGNIFTDGNLTVAGTLTAGAISYSTASVSNNFQVGGVIKAADGTASFPSYTFTNNMNTGLYRVGTNVLGFTTGGTQRFRIGDTGASLSVPFELTATAS
ncbi:MAG: hypothetical protein KBC81_03730, partial [Candidatus Pacebacteria bacterium]|nr:hypothetical protein [Candidatus Paceibacterota bacterium]